MRLIVNADDFGISRGVNLGIIEAHKRGVVTSATLMCNMPEALHGVTLAKDCPNLGIGIHFVLTAGKPLCHDVGSLVDEKGLFLKGKALLEKAHAEDIRKEFICQMNKFLSFGIEPSHIDSHHHVHTNEKVLTIVEDIAREFNIPVRMGQSKKLENKAIKTTQVFVGRFYDNGYIEPENFIELVEKHIKSDSIEIMCHPGFLDLDIMNKSSYLNQRAKELDTLTQNKVKDYIKENDIQLINFSDL